MVSQYAADVVIVGGGPAGSVAAYYLARSGVDVILVDKATFPRDKSCGDGLGFYTVEMLRELGLFDWLQNEKGNPFTSYLFSSPDGTSAITRPSPGLVECAFTAPRYVLDAKIVERAVEAGARLVEGVCIKEMERLSADKVRLLGTRDDTAVTIESPLVIAADGGQVSFTRRLGLAPHQAEWVAVRAYYDGDTGDPGQLEIHWEQSVMPGYCWIFPGKDGRANVGIGVYSRDVKELHLNLHALLDTFIEKNPHAQARLKNARRATPKIGHPLRADAYRVTPFAANVLVAGEAAGVVNPLTGEGIAHSMIGGKLAAQHAEDALAKGDFSAETLSAYGRAFHKDLDGFQHAARMLRSMFTYPWIINRVIRRASHDVAYAHQLNDIIVGKDSPSLALRPGMAIKSLLG